MVTGTLFRSLCEAGPQVRTAFTRIFQARRIAEKDHLIRQGNIVVDLGAAPGGWSEYAVKCIGDSGRVIACDILPIRPIRNVQFLQGDFREDEVFKNCIQ